VGTLTSKNGVFMKFSKLTLSVLAGLACASTVQAAETTTNEFHGYFRSGFLASAENDFKRSNFAGQKETLGRLGLEADNDYKANFVSNWDFDDGRNFRLHFGVGKADAEGALTSSADGIDTAITDTFMQLNGVSPSGTFWAGRREYGKEGNYIFMTDLFYTDMSGLGVGIEKMEFGDSSVDVAYILSDQVDASIDRWEEDTDGNLKNRNNVMHAIHLGATFGDLLVSGLFKAMPDNWDAAGNEWAEMGYDLTLTYKMYDFFGTGKGFSNAILQGGKGLGAGNLLGGTITDYNAYAPGSLAQGEQAWATGPDQLTNVEDDDTSVRALLWGGYNFSNGMNLFPSVQAQYNDMAAGDARAESGYNYWISVMARGTMPISQHMYLQGEVGYVHNNWDGGTWDQSKVTIAPTFILPTSYGVNPEIRLLASYLPQSWTNINDQGDADSDFIVGFQADVWW
jgi:maltoporin